MRLRQQLIAALPPPRSPLAPLSTLQQLEDQFNPTKAEGRAGGYLNPPAKYLKHYNTGSSDQDAGRDQWDKQMKDLPRGEITRLTTAWKALQKQTAAATKAQGNVDEDDYGKSPVVSHFANVC